MLLLDSLREVATQEGESTFFAPEYAALLGDEAAVRRELGSPSHKVWPSSERDDRPRRRELKEHPARLELLHQVVESGFTRGTFLF